MVAGRLFVVSDGLGTDTRRGAYAVDLLDGAGVFLGAASDVVLSSRTGNIWVIDGRSGREFDARTFAERGQASPTEGDPKAPVGAGLLTQVRGSVAFEVPDKDEPTIKILGEGTALDGAGEVAMWERAPGEVMFTDPNTGQALAHVSVAMPVRLAALSPAATRYAIVTDSALHVGEVAGPDRQTLLLRITHATWVNDADLLVSVESGDVFVVHADNSEASLFARVGTGALAVLPTD